MNNKLFFSVICILCVIVSYPILAQTPHVYGTIIESQSGGSPVIYMGQDINPPNRYLQIINSTNSTTAGGLFTGGIMVADNYGYAAPAVNDVVVKGNVSIGATSSFSKLRIVNVAGGFDPSKYLVVEGTTSDNNNYPGIQFRGGTLVSNEAYPYVTSTNGGLGLALVGGVHDTYNQRMSIDISSNTAGYSKISWQRNGTHLMYLDGDTGNLGIGTGTDLPDAKLSVKGDIHTQEVRVDMIGAVAPDYVFKKDYELWTLPEVEKFIQDNRHLPGVPSAREMAEEGIKLKEMNLTLLKKIEELTLYQIELLKRLEFAETKIVELETKLE